MPVHCKTCRADLSTGILSVESYEEVLWEYSGVYCPRCVATALALVPDLKMLINA